MHIGIIGGGIAGSVVADMLHRRGLQVTVLDKARGPGGRMSSRRSDVGRFDHGVPFFHGGSEAFRHWLQPWIQQGIVAQWLPEGGDTPVWVAVPKMNRLVGAVQKDVPVTYGCRVVRVHREPEGWGVYREDDTAPVQFDGVVLAIPAPQAHALLHDYPELQAEVGRITYAPCWSVMLQYRTPLQLDRAVFQDEGAIAYAVNEACKPGRDAGGRWVVQMDSSWTQNHLEWASEDVAREVAELFQRVHGCTNTVCHAAAHRWRYSVVSAPHDAHFLEGDDGTLAVCGDGFGGAGIEAAVASAQALAAAFPHGVQS